jgi:hypothetical protein
LKDKIAVRETPLLMDEVTEMRVPLDQLSAAEALDWEWFSRFCPGAMKGCGALVEEQYCSEDHLPSFYVDAGSERTQSDVHFDWAVLKHFVSKQPIVQPKVRVWAVNAGVCPLKRDECAASPQAEHFPQRNVWKHDTAPRPGGDVVCALNDRRGFRISSLHINQTDFLDGGILVPAWMREGDQLFVDVLVGAAVFAINEDPVAVV